MSFFDIYGERLINRRCIREARLYRKDGHGRGDTILTLDDGERVNLAGNHIDDLLEERAIVPAEAGFRLLRYLDIEGTDDAIIDEHPVIAWRIVGNSVYPLCPEGAMNSGDSYDIVVLYPDGRVVSDGDREWPNRREWEEDKAIDAANKRAFEAEEAAKEKREREAAEAAQPTALPQGEA